MKRHLPIQSQYVQARRRRSKINFRYWREFVAVGIALGLSSGQLWADPTKNPQYTFEKIATIGDPAPGPRGSAFHNDFEVGGINSSGDIAFGSDLDQGEAVYLRHSGEISALGRSGDPAPGGGTFDPSLFLGPVALNELGDVAFNFVLSPYTAPVGVNSGAYRYSHGAQQVTPAVVPFVTAAPTGGEFQGVWFYPSLNNRGILALPGIISTANGIPALPLEPKKHLKAEPATGLGTGIFLADPEGNLSAAVVPGDKAPEGGTFDWVVYPWINDRGDLAFTAHVANDECRATTWKPQAYNISCLGNIYVRKAGGPIQLIAHAGRPAPGGGTFRQAVAPVMNNRGDVVFLGDLTPWPDAYQVTGIFLYSGGTVIRIAGPNDPMPGGGRFVTASTITGNQIHINNNGEVVFNAVMDTDVDGDGVLDTGLFLWSNGKLRLVARTGTDTGVGTIRQLEMAETIIAAAAPVFNPNSGAINNDNGQVLFGATLQDGSGVMLLATPR